MLSLVFLDPDTYVGRVCDPDLPILLASDAAVTHGDGIFETMLYARGELLDAAGHWSRFLGSAKLLDLEIPDIFFWKNAVLLAIDVALNSCSVGGGEFVVRVSASRGVFKKTSFSGWVSVGNVPESIVRQRESGVSAVSLLRDSFGQPWMLREAKVLSYATNLAALRYAKSLGFDEAIFVDSEGFILEGATSNVTVLSGNTFYSPPCDSNILSGVTQKVFLETAENLGFRMCYKKITELDVYTADAVFLTSSVRRAAPVNYFNNRKINNRELFVI